MPDKGYSIRTTRAFNSTAHRLRIVAIITGLSKLLSPIVCRQPGELSICERTDGYHVTQPEMVKLRGIIENLGTDKMERPEKVVILSLFPARPLPSSYCALYPFPRYDGAREKTDLTHGSNRLYLRQGKPMEAGRPHWVEAT